MEVEKKVCEKIENETIVDTIIMTDTTATANNKSSESELESDAHFDTNLSFDMHLDDKPDVLKYIKQLQKYAKRQEKKIKKLRNKLKRYKSGKKEVKSVNVCTQTEEIENKTEPKTLVEEIKEAAENAVAQTGFVYESTSGMYYDYNTGYYYNAELGLYYDGNKGMYLVYNPDTKSYDFHSQIEVNPSVNHTTDMHKRKKQQKEKECKRKRNKKPVSDTSDNEASLEEGECFTSDDNCSQNSSNDLGSSEEDNISEISKSWPPCMRVIVKETDLKNVKIGSLFIITYNGGTIGREGDHAILLSDINISKSHAKISFDKEDDKYVIVDLGSRNGTVLNGKRISASKQESDPHEVVHGSVLQIGSSKLLCHIHNGLQTCGHCEPGLVQANVAPVVVEVDTKEKESSKGTKHKKELRRLKKRFGLEAQGNDNSELATGYTDRARVRRKEVGSQNSNEKTQVTSTDESISSSNKGFKMLAKMGWNEGQALGKSGTGLLEPVKVSSNVNKTGLGAAEDRPPVTVDAATKRKAKIWRKTQDRFLQVEESTSDVKEDLFMDEV